MITKIDRRPDGGMSNGVIKRMLSVRKWPPHQLALLKWSSALFGTTIGVYYHTALMPYIGVLLIGAIVLAVPVLLFFILDSED